MHNFGKDIPQDPHLVPLRSDLPILVHDELVCYQGSDGMREDSKEMSSGT